MLFLLTCMYLKNSGVALLSNTGLPDSSRYRELTAEVLTELKKLYTP